MAKGKYSSIGRIKKVTNLETGEETRKIEFTQNVIINRNATAYVNNFIENIDRLVENGAIDVEEGLKRKASAKQTFKTKSGKELLVETTHQIMLDVESNKLDDSTKSESF